MPYPIEVNDTHGVVWYHYTSGEFADMIVEQFDEMLAQSERQPLVCPISLHPFADRVWLTRPRDICAHIESLPKGTVPGSEDV